MTGKGDKPRPLSVPRKVFDDNWDRIFKPSKMRLVEDSDEVSMKAKGASGRLGDARERLPEGSKNPL